LVLAVGQLAGQIHDPNRSGNFRHGENHFLVVFISL